MFRSPKSFVVLVALAAGVYLAYQFWRWEIERVEVPPLHFLVVVNRWGKDLDPEQILAPDDSYKGVQLEVRGPGRHFLNPFFATSEVEKMVSVPAGKCMVLTRKFGKPISPERIADGDLVARDDERGIVEKPFLAGTYSINPHAYDVKIEDVVEIKAEFVGVRIVKVGKNPRLLARAAKASPYLVTEEGYRGVHDRYLPPGTYPVNRYVETIAPIEVRSHKVEFTDIQFPSKDGFQLRPHVQVEYAVMKEKAPEVLVRVTDEGMLNQADGTKAEIEKNEILQKIVLPHVRGFTRIEGSNFNATDFITLGSDKDKSVNSREQFQKALLSAVKPRCEDMGIEIRAVTLATMELPPELTAEISARDRALAEQQRNLEMVKQHKQEQTLKAAEALAVQKTQKVQAGTRLNNAETEAQQLIEVEKQKLTAALTVAQSQLEAAREKAKSVRAQAQAKADVILADNKAEAAPLRKSVEGFGGGQAFAQYTILSKVAPALAEIFATDSSEFGKLFSGLMLPDKESGAARMPAEAERPSGAGPRAAGK